jgi:hypothetical protein
LSNDELLLLIRLNPYKKKKKSNAVTTEKGRNLSPLPSFEALDKRAQKNPPMNSFLKHFEAGENFAQPILVRVHNSKALNKERRRSSLIELQPLLRFDNIDQKMRHWLGFHSASRVTSGTPIMPIAHNPFCFTSCESKTTRDATNSHDTRMHASWLAKERKRSIACVAPSVEPKIQRWYGEFPLHYQQRRICEHVLAFHLLASLQQHNLGVRTIANNCSRMRKPGQITIG